MKLNQLRDLIAIAEHGGLRRAARHLGVAQPAITRSIRELERELGAPLFERSATGMTLTPIGQAFMRRSMAARLELDRACDEVRQLKGVHTGAVSVGLSTAPHVGMLPQVLARFQRRFPDVVMKITEGLFPAMEGQVRDGSIDFYVGPLAETIPCAEFSVEKLFDNWRVILARPGHPLARARSLRELVSARWVATSVTSRSDAELCPLFERQGLPMPKIAVHAHSALTMITVASSSDLLAILPQQWLDFLQSAGLLIPIVLDEQLPAPPICIVKRSRLPLVPIAEHLSDLFRRACVNLAVKPAPRKAPTHHRR